MTTMNFRDHETSGLGAAGGGTPAGTVRAAGRAGPAALFTEGIVTILAVLVLASIAAPGRRGTIASPRSRQQVGPLSR